ncbi:MAG: family 1 glycosylhydrolase [Candidatus Moraniibacteriota bacterium]
MKNFKTKKFLWGVNNIGYQTEGNNYASNWHSWERRALVPISGRVNKYWDEFKNDNILAEELGVGAMRISLEWSRIEPREGEFDPEAILHYRKILIDLRERKIKAVVGLWHWSVPMWFEEKYGLHDKAMPKIFLSYSQYVLDNLGDLIDVFIVLNEPMVLVGMGYIRGEHPPFNKNLCRAWKTVKNFISIQKRVYRLAHKKSNNILVGSAHLINYYFPASEKNSLNYFLEKGAVKLSEYFRYLYLLNKTRRYQDFIGINYYRRSGLKFDFFREGVFDFKFKKRDNPHNPQGWRKFPRGIYYVCKNIYRKFKKPIIILENGKPTDCILDDCDRVEFIRKTVAQLEKIKKEKIDLRGYFHYSLTDAYEWTGGYDYFFGLVQIDRRTLARQKRKSFYTYQKIIKRNLF